jgi:hypothetical protein
LPRAPTELAPEHPRRRQRARLPLPLENREETRLGERTHPAVAVLLLVLVEVQHAIGEVDPVPREPEDLIEPPAEVVAPT